MVGCSIAPRWRQFICRSCSRIISDCRPSGTPSNAIPTIDELECCAICSRRLAEKPRPSPAG